MSEEFVADGRLRIFCSLPMKDKSEEDIEAAIRAMRRWFLATQTTGGREYRPDEVKFIDNASFKPDVPEVPAKVISGATRAYCLGEAIKKMSRCDLVLFSNEWLKATGCRFEMDICRAYHIPYIIMKNGREDDGGCFVG